MPLALLIGWPRHVESVDRGVLQASLSGLASMPVRGFAAVVFVTSCVPLFTNYHGVLWWCATAGPAMHLLPLPCATTHSLLCLVGSSCPHLQRFCFAVASLFDMV